MREIEFRAWDKNTRIMYQPEKIHNIYFWNGESEDVVTNGLIPHGCNDIVLMQYTGLKDKNGVKIYEGDICKYTLVDADDLEIITEVCFGGGIYDGSYTHKAKHFYKGYTLLYNEKDEYEIIGSIYENKELLK